MQTSFEKDLTCILYIFAEADIIIVPGVIATNAHQVLMNACNVVYKKSKHMLCYRQIQSNIKAQHQRDFFIVEVEGET